ncbi:glycosyltransferase [Phormidium sp. CLA17]|uniref:glycosyltransferase n=1 Tax=Leptolyngbya sp. Cla-17 TaxID=2803751 RepID=UPI0014921214|nr:glycosyltransferase [Leptolyngbya sp. Cla-17]MBM0744678.1 glycosyltransferase [Leptolyngbya sp. Cla-17]
MKKKVLVIFPNEWLAYTPTLLNLTKETSDDFDFKVLTIDDGTYKNSALSGEQFDFIPIHPLIPKVQSWLVNAFGASKFYQLAKIIVLFIRTKAYVGKVDEVIAIDSAGLWIAQKAFGNCHFMSLELFTDLLFKQCDLSLIESVIIQTQERYDYLFGDVDIKTSFIQNAPVYQPSLIKQRDITSKKAIFLGNANARNGVYYCIEAIRNIEDISLTIKGTISSDDRKQIETQYADLLKSKKVIIDDRYLEQDELIEYLSQFYVGFCFYDLSCTDDTTRFNFVSVPSGKLFNYYAAGVPVIGSSLPGLISVKEFETGLLLKNISTEEVLQALEYIDNRHEELSENCLKAAAHFDFNSSVKPFREYLLSR